MELEYPEIEKRVFEKYKKTKADIIEDIIFYIIVAIIFIALFILMYFTNESLTTKENEKLKKEILVYEQILDYEYNRTFESFEEYIVYRADKILGE